MKEITIITNYFPPETGAASNRIAKMALGLQERGFEVSVVCPLPNYPKGKIFKEYQGKIAVTETYEGIEVNRLWVYANNSGNKFKRLLGMVSFSISFFFFSIFRNRKIARMVIIQSPPLIIAHAALRFLSKKKRASAIPLYLKLCLIPRQQFLLLALRLAQTFRRAADLQ